MVEGRGWEKLSRREVPCQYLSVVTVNNDGAGTVLSLSYVTSQVLSLTYQVVQLSACCMFQKQFCKV